MTLTLALLTTTLCSGQEIEIKNFLGYYKYKQSGKRMSIGVLKRTIESSPEMLDLIKKASPNYTLASFLSSLGASLLILNAAAPFGGGVAN